jgi:hypothetical protein
MHTGEPSLDPPKYVGLDVHLAARVMAAGHGGQVVLSAATASFVQAPLTDLGKHRLKDFAAPVALFQLGSKRFPPLKTIANTNLPKPASSFIGREREVAEIVELFRGGARLVTLSGPAARARRGLRSSLQPNSSAISVPGSSGSDWRDCVSRLLFSARSRKRSG